MVLKNPDKYQKGKTIVYFVRHGDRAEREKGEPAYGCAGPGLSVKGKKQAKEVAKKFKKIKEEVDVFYCSSMNRAIETATEISKVLKKKYRVHDELSEFNQILWKRKYYHYRYWKHYRKHKMSLKIFDKILENNKGKVIVIVSHGNIIKGLVGSKLGLTFRQMGAFDYHNCHISMVRFKGKNLDHIHYFNESDPQ